MAAAEVYAFVLALLGAWGIYAMRQSVTTGRRWSRRRRLAVAVDALFVASCLGCAAALWTGRFQAWMAAPLGLSYALMIPLPCYFEAVNRVRWLHALRNVVFGAVALVLLAVAAGGVALSVLGLP